MPQTVDIKLLLEILRQLVEAESINPPGYEYRAAQVVIDFCRRWEALVHLDEAEPGRPNVIAEIGKGNRSITLTTHLDVVPAGDQSRWSYPPFIATEKGYRIYGRGTCDAKGSLAAMLYALYYWSRRINELTCRMQIAAVYGEERGGLGSKRLIANNFHSDFVIVGEPTGLSVVIAQKGRIELTFKILGRAAHPSAPEPGENAIFQAGKMIQFLNQYAKDLSTNTHPLVGEITLTPNLIQAGDPGVLTVPEECILQVERRVLPNETQEGAMQEFLNAWDEFAGRQGVRYTVEKQHQGAAPFAVATNHPLFSIVREAYQIAGLDSPMITGFPTSCDMYTFGLAGMPVITIGPGYLAQAHAVDEFVPVDELQNAARIYIALIQSFAKRSCEYHPLGK